MADQPAARPTKDSAFDLRIGELVLRGHGIADRYAFAEAFERELVRLFHDSGAPLSLVDGVPPTTALPVGRIDAGSFVVPHGASSAVLGTQAARALHRSLATARSASERTGTQPAQAPRGSSR
jgi:hypothetical protein